MKTQWKILLWLTIASVDLAMMLMTSAAFASGSANLSGEWRFALDRTDVGVKDQWFGKDLPDHIKLPSVLQAQG